MKNKIIRLLVAIGIVCAILFIAASFNILVVILSKMIGFDLKYVLIPIFIAWLIWLVYRIINYTDKDIDNKKT